MTLFKKKQQISRARFRKVLRKASPYIPGAGTTKYSLKERVEIEKKVFRDDKYGDYISKQEYRDRLRELRKEKYRAKTREERLKIDHLIRYLKELGGV